MGWRSTTGLLLSGALLACAEEPSIDLPGETDRAPIADGDGDLSTREAPCDQAPDGTSCGLEMHCIFNVCAKNVCGDGVILGMAEACDDGNDRDADGCDSRCQLEVPPGCGNGVREPGEACDDAESIRNGTCTDVCTTPVCGDGIISPGETCDDGNASDGDRCSRRCQIIPERCGNGDRDSSEACDDGNNLDGDGCQSDCTLPVAPMMDAGIGKVDAGDIVIDAGPEPVDAGKTDAGAITPDAGVDPVDAGMRPVFGTAHENAACKECRELNCADYLGQLPLLARCFENEDPAFVQQCVDLLECAYQNDCGYSTTGTAECFCGTFDLATCQTAGKQDGPCIAEVYQAARASSLKVVVDSLGDVSTPLGTAVYFQECDNTLCPACKP